MPTVQQMLRVINSMAKRRYLPNSGTASEVGGMISARSKKNTVRLTSDEMLRVTFSHDSDGR